MMLTTTNGTVIDIDEVSAERRTAAIEIHKGGRSARIELNADDLREIAGAMDALRQDWDIADRLNSWVS